MVSKELPSDIIFEILTRTPSLQTLDTCKLVCESWDNLIRETSFMPLYCQRTKNLSGYFMQDIKDHKYLSTFVSIDQSQEHEGGSSSSLSNVCMERLIPDDLQILASCNQGILCCLKSQSKGNLSRFYACKPATKQWRSLPNPKLRYKTDAIAIMVLGSSPLRYKIIRLSNRGIVGSISTYKCEIFDSKIWRWKETQDVKLPYDELIIRSSSTSVTIGNSVHWLTSHDNVLAYHELEGTFQKFPLPHEVLQDANKKLMEYQGRLELICKKKKKGDTELWIMSENPRINCTSWRKKMSMDIDSLLSNVTYPSLAGFYNDGIALLKAVYEVVFYKLEDGSSNRVELEFDLRFAREIFRFRSDLEPVEFGRF